MDQALTWFGDNAVAIGTLGIFVMAMIAWLWPRGNGRNGVSNGIRREQIGRDRGGQYQAGHDIVQRDQTNIGHQVKNYHGTQQETLYSRHQLRRPTADFIGRRDQVNRIKRALLGGGAALEGMGGSGKTETALVAAQELVQEGRFKDAQMYIDLQGYALDTHTAKSPTQALRKLLRPLVDTRAVLPNELADLQALWTERTAGLDMLLFLDNAAERVPICSLLPGHKSCAVLLTSRDRLSVPGLIPVDFLEMRPKEGASLCLALANRHDSARLNEEDAGRLTELCGHSPLFIQLSANALANSRGAPVEDFLMRLEDHTKPLPELQKGKAILALSLEMLDMAKRACWQQLGVFEDGFTAEAAGVIWQSDDPQRTLNEFERRSLVNFDQERHRYGLHDLLRALALQELGADATLDATTRARHSQHFLQVLERIGILCFGDTGQFDEGLKLLDCELSNIRSGQAWASKNAIESKLKLELTATYPTHILNLLMTRLPIDGLIDWSESALDAADALSPTTAQVEHRLNLAFLLHLRALRAKHQLGNKAARKDFSQAEYLYELILRHNDIDDSIMTIALFNLGSLKISEEEDTKAVKYLRRALDMAHDSDDCIKVESISRFLSESGDQLSESARDRSSLAAHVAAMLDRPLVSERR